MLLHFYGYILTLKYVLCNSISDETDYLELEAENISVAKWRIVKTSFLLNLIITMMDIWLMNYEIGSL